MTKYNTAKAAVKTLKRKGYTYHGGEEWKPPLGMPPACLFRGNKPENLNIMGVPFNVVYCKEISEVHPDKVSTVFGYSALKSHEIRIFDGASIEFTWQTIIHEILHMVGDMTRMDILQTSGDDKNHRELDCLANILADTLFRNDLIRI